MGAALLRWWPTLGMCDFVTVASDMHCHRPPASCLLAHSMKADKYPSVLRHICATTTSQSNVASVHMIVTTTSNDMCAGTPASLRREQAVQPCDARWHPADADVIAGLQRLRCMPLRCRMHNAPPQQPQVLADHVLWDMHMDCWAQAGIKRFTANQRRLDSRYLCQHHT